MSIKLLFCRADVKNLAFDFTVLLPNLNFTGNYSMQLRLLLANINGKGTLKGQFSKKIFKYVIELIVSYMYQRDALI